MENLLAIWTKEGLLLDKNDDGVIDGLHLSIDLPDGLAPEGLIDFCARLGFETTSLSFNFFEQNREDSINVRFVFSEVKTEARIEQNELILTYKNEAELSTLLRLLAAMKPAQHMKSTFVELKGDKLYTDVGVVSTIPGQTNEMDTGTEMNSLSDLWSFSGFGKNQEASPSKLLHLNVKVEESLLSTDLLREICFFVARAAMYSTEISFPLTGNPAASVQFELAEGNDTVLNMPQPNTMILKGTKAALPSALNRLANAAHWSEGGTFGYWEKEYQDSERSESPLLFEMNWSAPSEVDVVYEKLTTIKDLENMDIELFLSEPADIRNKLALKWREQFPAVNSLSIKSAFKPGFHWLVEEILPKLRELAQPLQRINIKVREEQGAHGLELPIRWIQELYPVDRYIEKQLGFSSELVDFTLEKELPHTYEVVGYDQHGEQQYLGYLDVPVSTMKYINGKNYVYPVSSSIRVKEAGKVVEEYLIPTDRERFYSFYIEEVLSKLRQDVADYYPGQGYSRPLFDRIEIDVWMSEEEKKWGVDEERISALEALHEDLYFNTLDYFEVMGEELEGKPFNAPGGVYPFMHLRVGEKPVARVKVYAWRDQPLRTWLTKSISFDENGKMISAQMTDGDEERNCPVRKFKKPSQHIHPDVQRWMDEHSLRYRVVYPDTSYRGQEIPVIECFLKTDEEFVAPLKLSLFKKTIFIEAGHHPNEVSSTPAVLQLIERANDSLGDWLKDINLVILPLANPDGYQLLTKLVSEHPEWKHHAARYNAVGLEYSLVRFHETVFGEANVYPEILRRWAPDVIVDDHGIPSHEWVQPFAGYNSPPRFPVSYFLPSAKIYGIGRLSTGPYRSQHEQNLETIVQSISDSIRGTDIEKENQYWQERFIKYGNQWLPEVFPIEEAPGIHFYRQAEVTPSYSTIGITRYPEWVAAEIISEAADEVVYGEVLQSCIEAHILFDLAILDVLKKSAINVTYQYDNTLTYQRVRPLQL